MANRIVLNPISYHGKGAIESIVPEVQARDLTQSTLAEALGVSDRAVSRWENGASALEKLAAEDTAYCHAASAIRDILAALP